MYRCWKERASHRNRRVVLTPWVSEPQWERPNSANCEGKRGQFV